MPARFSRSKKEKVTVSVDAHLLRAIDAYVKEAKQPGISRSSVFEEALQLWKQESRDRFDALYYAGQAGTLRSDKDSWSWVTTEAARHIWKDS